MKVAVFGGSFDPVHIEHIRLVQAAIQELGLDKLYVMPAHTPPHKKGKELSSNEARLEMCQLAFRGEPKVVVSDYEIAKGGTSYTYLTCQYFKKLYASVDDEIFWIVGTDMLRNFPMWKNPENILENVTLAVCSRAEEKETWREEEQAKFVARFGEKFKSFSYKGADVSSTKIRVLAGAGMDLTPLIDQKVAEYIQQKGLYEIPGAAAALALEKTERKLHSLRVAELAASRAVKLGIPEKKAIQAALFHDCAKNLTADSPYLEGFVLEGTWGEVPKEVWHQFAGAYVAEKHFGITDREVLNAIRYHTSGRPNMCDLEKLIFLSDMLESERNYKGVEELRSLFWKGNSLDECLEEALYQTLLFLKDKKSKIYPLTQAAYEYVREYAKGTEV